MKNNTLKLTVSLAAVLFFAAHSATGQTVDAGRIAGTWEVQVSVVNCDTGFPFATFPALATFGSDGTLIVSEGGVAPSTKAPAHGIWSHTRGRAYKFKTRSFTFNEAGQLAGWIVINNNVTLNTFATEFTANGTAQIFLASGTQVGAGCSSLTATRLAFDQ
jgi:hypothetical protein